MNIFDRFKSERRKWARPAEGVTQKWHPALPAFDRKSFELYNKALPRGVLLPRLRADRERINYWMSFHELRRHHYVPGQIILGKVGNDFIGELDDRPMVTIAGARAGKSSTVLLPNLYLYPGSMLVLDPKGELARNAAAFRRQLGHKVYVLDPFGQSGEPQARFNFLDALDPEDPAVLDDIAQITAALVPVNPESKSRHFDDNARMLLLGLILLTLTLKKSERNLVTVRELLCLTYGPLVSAARQAQARRLAEASGDEKASYFNANGIAVTALLNKLASLGDRFGGIAAGIGNRFKETPSDERGSIFSTAAAHTDFLDSIPLRECLRHTDFRLEDLRGDQPVTIFLSLPVGHMERQSRWLRMFVQLCCLVLERMGPYPRERTPILFMMEEFAVLGHLDIMERAAAYFPGFGVKLWVVLQDITQLQRHYKACWETFLGNAGIVQLFANGDEATLRYASGRLQKLIEPFELRTAFSRERHSQVLLMEGLPPAALLRLTHDDVEQLRSQLLLHRPPLLLG
jgi:type IV secretion system protein VirD4